MLFSSPGFEGSGPDESDGPGAETPDTGAVDERSDFANGRGEHSFDPALTVLASSSDFSVAKEGWAALQREITKWMSSGGSYESTGLSAEPLPPAVASGVRLFFATGSLLAVPLIGPAWSMYAIVGALSAGGAFTYSATTFAVDLAATNAQVKDWHAANYGGMFSVSGAVTFGAATLTGESTTTALQAARSSADAESVGYAITGMMPSVRSPDMLTPLSTDVAPPYAKLSAVRFARPVAKLNDATTLLTWSIEQWSAMQKQH